MEKVLDKDINPITEKILEDCEKKFFKVYELIVKENIDKNAMISTNQMSNILRNIKNVSCIKELELFIKYQEARDIGRRKGWALKSNNMTMAEVLIEQVERVSEIAEKYLKSNAENKFSEEEFKIKTVEKLMGYCYWHVYHTYNKKFNGNNFQKNNNKNKRDNKKFNKH